MNELHYTHIGWWLFCPIKIGDLDTDCPLLSPRWFWCLPLYWLAWKTQGLIVTLCSLAYGPRYEPGWYFKITGELL